MAPKTRFTIEVAGKASIGCNTADEVLDALNDLKDAKGVTISDQQTGMTGLTREAIVELADGERE